MSQIRVKVQGPDKKSHVLTLNPADTFESFQTLVQGKTNLHPLMQQVLCGFPPREVVCAASVPLGTVIKSGDMIIINEKEDVLDGYAPAAPKQGGEWSYPSSINKRKGMMARLTMPADNSCLFHSVLRATNSYTHLSQPMELRERVANIVCSDPQTYNYAFLGMSNPAYAQHILNPDVWGGGIELAILSTALEVEIVTFDFHYLREDVFGEGKGYKRRIFLIYSGNHYDLMVFKDNGSETEIFSSQDDYAWERARHQAQFLHNEAASQGQCQRQESWRREIGDRQKKTAAAKSVGARLGGANWQCVVCTLENPDTSKNCSACGAGRDGIVPESSSPTRTARSTTTAAPAATSTSSTTRAGTASSDSTTIGGAINGGWQCESCTYMNAGPCADCEVCGLPNPLGEAMFPHEPDDPRERAPQPQAEPEALIEPIPMPMLFAPQMHPAFAGVGGYSPAAGLGGYSPAPPPEVPQGEWDCRACTYVNSTFSPRCSACNTPNPAAATPQPSTDDWGGYNAQGAQAATPFSAMFQSPRWICHQCGADNLRTIMFCKSCRVANPNALNPTPADMCQIS